MADLSIPILMYGFPQGDADPRVAVFESPTWVAEELREYVIQFTHSLLARERREMQISYGLMLEEYVPKYTYLEWIDEASASALQQHPLVNAALPKEVVDRTLSTIAETPETPGMLGLPQGEVVVAAADAVDQADRLLWVSLSPRTNPNEVSSALEGEGGRDVRVFDDRIIGGGSYLQVLMPAQDVHKIMEIEGVRRIENAARPSADGVDLPALLEVGFAGRPAPYLDNGLRGRGQTVGIIDSGGLDIEHCWFRDKQNIGPLHRKLVGVRNAFQGDGAHATFVAGILAGDDIDHAGAPLRGLACDARITFGNRKDADTGWVSLYKYLVLAAQDDAHVHNASWHDPRRDEDDPEYSRYAIDVDRFAWEYEECLVVGASGNNEEREHGLGPPGSAKNALCVSAASVDPTTGKAELADGVPGPTQDKRRKPDLLAPGCGIRSAKPSNGKRNRCRKGLFTRNKAARSDHTPDDAANLVCYASFATPVVSAAAVLVRQYFVEGRYPTGEESAEHKRYPTGALLKAMLLNATERVGRGYRYPTNAEGWGLLRLNRILRLPDFSRKIRVWDVRNAAGMFATDYRTHEVVVKRAGRPLKVTLVWTDPPGHELAADPVVNNLDLVVIAPDGETTYLGNWFHYGASSVGSPSKPAEPDTRNNVEMVLIRKAPAGPWTIMVKATEVNVGNTGQGYALVVRGALD